MKTIENYMLEEIYLKAVELAHDNKQTVGEKNNYYITLEQLEAIMGIFES